LTVTGSRTSVSLLFDAGPAGIVSGVGVERRESEVVPPRLDRCRIYSHLTRIVFEWMLWRVERPA